MDLRDSIRNVPDFPKKGIVFRDITTLLGDPRALAGALDALSREWESCQVAKVVGIESRGFILGGALAARIGAGFVPARKPGKLPARVLREEYALEYGTDAVEVHVDGIAAGDRVLMHDDLLATGGTMAAACRLVQALGGTIVGVSFIIELSFLQGRNRLPGLDVRSLITYDQE
ncbi:MAG: adenine phosphoribosyltransferase [Bacteroidota bacterium]